MTKRTRISKKSSRRLRDAAQSKEFYVSQNFTILWMQDGTIPPSHLPVRFMGTFRQCEKFFNKHGRFWLA